MHIHLNVAGHRKTLRVPTGFFFLPRLIPSKFTADRLKLPAVELPA
jgi:hypothetical protein